MEYLLLLIFREKKFLIFKLFSLICGLVLLVICKKEVTFFKKILNIVTFVVLCNIVIAQQSLLFAQINSEQQNQIKQYEQLIKDNKSKKQLKIAAYYATKKASVYLKAGFYQDAIDCYLEAAKYNDQAGKSSANTKIYNNVAMIYSELNQLQNTQKYFEKSLTISRRYNNRNDIAVSLMDVATILIYKKKYDKALENLEEALKISNALNDARLLRTCYNLMAQCYKAYGNNKKSNEYYDYFLVYDKQVKEKGVISREKQSEKTIEKKEKELDIALTEKKRRELEIELLDERKKRAEDSLNQALSDAEKTRKIIELEKEKAERETEEQKRQREYQEALVASEKANTELYRLYLIGAIAGGSLLLLGIIGIIFALQQKRKANKQLEQQNLEIAKQKDEIENKSNELQDAMGHIQVQNKNIMQSINYAQRIQDAMLPKQLGMKSLFPDSFIFFKPRDVVSGDFYWFDEVNKQTRNGNKNPGIETNRKERKIFISAVDCTGHGVPGAFMSMLGFNLLNDIVRRGTTESQKILGELHKGIRKSLNQEHTQNRDGMDMALCVIDPINKVMEYSGAQNPLIYIQDGQLFRIRGNKFPVGGYQMEEHNYTKHLVSIEKPTTCYIFSDGFPDQFGGPNGRKFMAKNFRDLLYEIHQMPMEEQESILELVINEWMGQNEQTDDILVIGFKIDIKDGLLEINGE